MTSRRIPDWCIHTNTIFWTVISFATHWWNTRAARHQEHIWRQRQRQHQQRGQQHGEQYGQQRQRHQGGRL